MGTRVFVFFSFLLATPVFAVDLVGVNIDSISASVHANGSCESPAVALSIGQGDTGSFDLGACGVIELSVIGHQVLVAAVSPATDTNFFITSAFTFTAPSNGVSAPVIFSGSPSSPALIHFSNNWPPAATGTIGGKYSLDGSTEPPVWPRTVFLIGGDSVTTAANFLAYFHRSNAPPPSSPSPTWELWTVAAPAPPTPECTDGIDNDGDGLIDLDDPHCGSTDDLSELPPPLPHVNAGMGCGLGPELAGLIPLVAVARRLRQRRGAES